MLIVPRILREPSSLRHLPWEMTRVGTPSLSRISQDSGKVAKRPSPMPKPVLVIATQSIQGSFASPVSIAKVVKSMITSMISTTCDYIPFLMFFLLPLAGRPVSIHYYVNISGMVGGSKQKNKKRNGKGEPEVNPKSRCC